MNLLESLATGLSHGGARPALVAGDRVVTYGELARQAGSLAAHLRRLGVRAGDRVALLAPNVPEYVVAYYGILGAGAVAVPVNSRARAPEMQYIFADCAVRSTIAHPAALPEVRQVIAGQPGSHPLIALGESAAPGIIPLAQLVGDRGALDPGAAAADDLAQISYTSGTTGKPKGVMLTHRNLALNAESTAAALGLGPDDRQIALAPLLHILGCTLVMNATLLVGAAAVFCPAPDPDTVMGTIEQQRCTLIGAVPTLYILLLRHPRRYDLRSLRIAMTGGAATPAEVLDGVPEKLGVPIVEGYGITEIAGSVSLPPFGGLAKRGSVGVPVRYVEMAILDDANGPLGPGQVGEICLRGPTVMRGYYGQPEATAQALQGGWLHSGDVGYVDEDGYCFIVDRKKDVIVTSGFNVYPREVEDVLHQHPAVAEAGVVGVPDPVKGELVHACLVLRPEAAATEAELIAFCRERLTPYKVPVAVEFFPSLPKGATGKMLRRELRELLGSRG